MKSFEAEDLKIEIVESEGVKTLTWLGKSLISNTGAVLDPFFEEIVKECKGNKITMDFTKLLIMNSSTVPPILSFIKNMEESKNYLEVIYDDSKFWQHTSFRLLNVIILPYKYVKLIKI
jgi:hypothetical protein